MKKSIVVVVALVVFVLGFYFGARSMNRATKWVEHHGGLDIICTEFFGNVYTAVAEKESYNFNVHILELSRR